MPLVNRVQACLEDAFPVREGLFQAFYVRTRLLRSSGPEIGAIARSEASTEASTHAHSAPEARFAAHARSPAQAQLAAVSAGYVYASAIVAGASPPTRHPSLARGACSIKSCI